MKLRYPSLACLSFLVLADVAPPTPTSPDGCGCGGEQTPIDDCWTPDDCGDDLTCCGRRCVPVEECGGYCQDDFECVTGMRCLGHFCMYPPREPKLVVVPDEVDFGRVPLFEESVQTVEIRNLGDAALLIRQYQISRDTFPYQHPELIVSPASSGADLVQPGQSLALELWVLPVEVTPTPAWLIIFSDDPDQPYREIPIKYQPGGTGVLQACALQPALSATALELPLGEECESATSVSFGALMAGQDATRLLALANVGESASLLIIHDAWLEVTSGSASSLSLALLSLLEGYLYNGFVGNLVPTEIWTSTLGINPWIPLLQVSYHSSSNNDATCFPDALLWLETSDATRPLLSVPLLGSVDGC